MGVSDGLHRCHVGRSVVAADPPALISGGPRSWGLNTAATTVTSFTCPSRRPWGGHDWLPVSRGRVILSTW